MKIDLIMNPIIIICFILYLSLQFHSYHCIQSAIMLENSWSNKLTHTPKIATILNIPNPTIVYQNTTNQLIAHSQSETSPLPIRKDIVAIGCLPTSQILLLSRYQLSCFDLVNNNQLFNLQFENAEKLYVQGKFIYVVCGGDLFCYNSQGEQQYVNHCSSNIQSLTSLEQKGNIQITLALNDLTLVRYRGVNISFDYGKTSGTASSICWIGQGVLVGTHQGPVSFHEGKKSKWKAKSNHPVFRVMSHLCDGTMLAVIGRKDGVVELKDWKGKGETIHKVKLQEQIVGMFIHDFRREENQQLICICKGGTVKGLNIYEQAKKVDKKQVADQIKLQHQSLEILQNQKLNLEFEIAQLKQQIANYSQQNPPQHNQQILKPDFSYKTYLHHEPGGLTIWIQCFNGYISGLTFEEAVMPVFFERTNQVKYLFKAENMIFGEINCYILVHSNFTSKIYQTRGFKITLPKFWKFGTTQQIKQKIQGGVRFNCVERNARYIKWFNQCFFLRWTEEERTKLEQQPNLKMKFYNSYDKIPLQMNFISKEGKIQILSDCIKTLGDVFQDLIQYMGLKQLDSQLWFPKQKVKLQNTLQLIERLSQTKVSISSQMAEAIENIKFMLVKGESARCVGSMKQLRRTYADVMGFNRNLLTQIQKKNQNTKQLSQSLKVLGNMINQTANVRFGKSKQVMIAGCREAIKKKQFPKIIAIMERGATAV